MTSRSDLLSERKSGATIKSKGAFETLNLAFRADQIHGPSKAVLLVLAKHATGSTGRSAYPSRETLRRQSGVRNSAVSEALNLLEEHFGVIRRTGQRANGNGRPTVIWEIDHDALRNWNSDNESQAAVQFRTTRMQNSREAVKAGQASAAVRRIVRAAGDEDLPNNLSQPDPPPQSLRPSLPRLAALGQRRSQALSLMVEGHDESYSEAVGRLGTKAEIPDRYFRPEDDFDPFGAAGRLLDAVIAGIEDTSLGNHAVRDGLQYLTSKTAFDLSGGSFLGRILIAWRHPSDFVLGTADAR